MKKIIFAVNNVVESINTLYSDNGEISFNNDNHERFETDMNTKVEHGYTVTKNEDGTVTFNKP